MSPTRNRHLVTAYSRLVLKVIGVDNVPVVAAGGTQGVYRSEKPQADVLLGRPGRP